ncbi:kinase-like domain-containing protein [Chaetomium fimeti]|uniref:Kinase-like domain-containing protein n=1 Tax=Chaetomium fimeti TaxID=1854472 RepID=A0AAE0H8M1_9PEZI|nr:kinase-like domain-containing protein [Chaetomium fimeti]
MTFSGRPRASSRTMSTASESATKWRTDPFSVGDILCGSSGRSYNIEEILADRRKPLLSVYRASAQGNKYVIKNIIKDSFEYQQELQKPLSGHPNLRTLVDTIPDGGLFVYPFLRGDLLRFAKKPLSDNLRKSILRSALVGLVELHDRNIIHSDIKPNNILLDYEEIANQEIKVHSVQISDLEDAVRLRPGGALAGCISGNQIWRSPEAWARAKQSTPSDVYSFAIMAIYVMLKYMVFWPGDEAAMSTGGEAWHTILYNHISYFADEEGIQGLLELIGEGNEYYERLINIGAEVTARQPFTLWLNVDAEFRDLIVKMTNLDPARRITAREALEHPWFRQGGP